MKIIATSPGDIVIEFKIGSGNSMKAYVVPVKSISGNKSMDVSKEYGVGSHQAYAEVVGKIGYEGDFTVGSWYAENEGDASSWDKLVQLLTYQSDEGLPREFTINIHARSGAGMMRAGTGTYGTSGDTYRGSTLEDILGGDLDNNTTPSDSGESSNQIIMSFYRCILKGDGVDIPEVGGTVSRKYPFSCLYRNPK